MKAALHHSKADWNGRHVLALLLLTLACYWPLSLGVFSAKNDNITQFLPVRFQVSEALRHFELPLWSPFMYLGYPIHGDMQGGAWNPVVWILSLFGRYNLFSLHAEILIYIFLSALGMYRLLGSLKLDGIARLTGAACYMMCGYITDVGGSNLPFLAAAAWLPFTLAYYYQFWQRPSVVPATKCAMALCLFFVSAYPSFFMLTAYIMLAAFLAKFLVQKEVRTQWKPVILFHAWLAFCFLLLSGPAILSYAQVLPFYQRVNGVSLAAAMENAFHPSCSWSFLLPTLPVKDAAALSTDLISRNTYFNSLLLIALLFSFSTKKSLLKYFTLAGVVFFFLFSLGDHTPVRAICYRLLPLMDTFRHPSNARLFVIAGAIPLAMMTYTELQAGRKNRNIIGGGLAVVLLLLVISLWQIPKAALVSKVNALRSNSSGFRIAIKNFFDDLSFADTFLVNAAAQAFFILLFLWLIRSKKYRLLPAVIIANSFLFAQLSIPFTLVSKVSPREVNQLINSQPQGFPAPSEKITIGEYTADALQHMTTIGIISFYNKKISLPSEDYTPTFMTPIERVMKDSATMKTVMSHPYAFFADSIKGARFHLKEFGSNRFVFQTESQAPAQLCLQQLQLPGWKCSIDENPAAISTANRAFMAVAIPAGTHQVAFSYRPAGIRTSVIIALIMLLLSLGILFTQKTKHDQEK